jgi:hypothetical protein
MLGTQWEQTKNKNSPPPPNPKEKPLNTPEPSHWLHEISISKTVYQYFQPGN